MIEWKDPTPPATRSGRGTDWKLIADELRAHPGQWAVVAHDRGEAVATSIKRGAIAAFRPAGSFEARSRRQRFNEPKSCDIYARYVGDDQ